MSKKHTTLNASIIDTRRPTVAGADRHPGWHPLPSCRCRISTYVTTLTMHPRPAVSGCSLVWGRVSRAPIR